MITWKTADEVALRKAVLSIGEDRLAKRLTEECSSVLDAKLLAEASDSAVARLAAHKAGFDECIAALLRVALTKDAPPMDSGHQKM